MKKFISILLSTALCLSTFTIPVYAANDISVKINGKTLAFDVPPQTINGRTMVPMRVIFENLGANVKYTPASQTDNGKALIYAEKTASKMAVSMYIDDPFLCVNNPATNYKDETTALDAAPTVIDGRTLVPVRAIAKAFDCAVAWDGATKTVSITTDTKTDVKVPEVQEETKDLYKVKSITLDKKEHIMIGGESFSLQASIEPTLFADKVPLTWKSSNNKIATVSENGVVTAVNPGKATISIKTPDGKSASCKVTVKDVKILAENVEYGPMTINYTYTSYDGFPMVLDSNQVKSFVFTNIEKSLSSYKLTANIQGKIEDDQYVNIDVYFYNEKDQCIGSTNFFGGVQEGADYNISDSAYVEGNIIENTQYIKFFSASGTEAKYKK